MQDVRKSSNKLMTTANEHIRCWLISRENKLTKLRNTFFKQSVKIRLKSCKNNAFLCESALDKAKDASLLCSIQSHLYWHLIKSTQERISGLRATKLIGASLKPILKPRNIGKVYNKLLFWSCNPRCDKSQWKNTYPHKEQNLHTNNLQGVYKSVMRSGVHNMTQIKFLMQFRSKHRKHSSAGRIRTTCICSSFRRIGLYRQTCRKYWKG